MEHAERNEEWIDDDHREQSCWKFKEQRIVERAIQSVLGMIRTIRSAIEFK